MNPPAPGEPDDELFWEIADPLIGSGSLEEGTIMQSRCVRSKGEFVAAAEHRTGDLVVKLPAARVAELIESGQGTPFAPAKRVFKEWVRIEDRQPELWEALMLESISFVSPRGGTA